MSHRWGSKRLTYLSAALLSLWMVGITVLIAAQPDPGAADPQELGVAFAAAVAANDRAGLKRLVPIDVETPVLDRLTQAAQCGQDVRATASRLEILRPDGTACGTIAITEHSGRWFIDPWADPVQRA